MRVTDSYDQFKQFAMQTVSAEDIARRFPKVTAPAEVTSKKTKKLEEFDIPKFGE